MTKRDSSADVASEQKETSLAKRAASAGGAPLMAPACGSPGYVHVRMENNCVYVDVRFKPDLALVKYDSDDEYEHRYCTLEDEEACAELLKNDELQKAIDEKRIVSAHIDIRLLGVNWADSFNQVKATFVSFLLDNIVTRTDVLNRSLTLFYDGYEGDGDRLADAFRRRLHFDCNTKKITMSGPNAIHVFDTMSAWDRSSELIAAFITDTEANFRSVGRLVGTMINIGKCHKLNPETSFAFELRSITKKIAVTREEIGWYSISMKHWRKNSAWKAEYDHLRRCVDAGSTCSVEWPTLKRTKGDERIREGYEAVQELWNQMVKPM